MRATESVEEPIEVVRDGEPIAVPLCVDLDGALLATDLLWESLAVLVRKRPGSLFSLPIWLLNGKAHLKSQIASRAVPDVARLPYREAVLAYIKNERDRGRRIILTTGADLRLAERVADHLGLFSAIIASDGDRNLTGQRKLAAITAHTGHGEFDYVGDSRADLPVWKAARQAIMVEPSPGLLRRARRETRVGHVFPRRERPLKALMSALRIHQWVKNVLLFVPLLVAHRFNDLGLVLQASWAFVAFCLCASAVYVTNDFLDLEHDRRHPRKRARPFASGRLPIQTVAFLAPALLLAGFTVAALTLSPLFVALLAFYVLLSNGYSLLFKRIVIVDVLVLAGLYTLRVIAGGVATGIVPSPWLLAFSLFLFFSLALAKRYSELDLSQRSGGTEPGGRGYLREDLPIILAIGPASGYMAVLVLALYMNSDAVTALYRTPALLWPVTPLVLYWITRVWFLAHRRVLTDDPIVFTLKDPVSYLVGGTAAIFLVAGMMW